MNKKKLVALMLISIMAISILLTGCGSAGGDKKILRVNNQTEPGSLNPAKAESTADSWVLEHVMQGLTKKAEDGTIAPGMADSWKVSDDSLTYTFTLKDGIKWSNGDPVTAKDFETQWKHVLDPATASTYAYIMYYIKGAEAYNTSTEKDAAKLQALQDAVGVKALDDKTLEVTLSSPTAYFIDLTSFYTYLPADSKIAVADPNWANEAKTYVSNGPFMLTDWEHKSKIVIKKNKNYYDKDKVKLNEIDFAMIEDENTAWQMYKSGQLDLAYTLPVEVLAQLRANNDKELVVAPDLSTYYYEFNTTKKPFNNVKVRQALAMAIDRQALVDNITQGGQQPAYSQVPPGVVIDGKDFRDVNPNNYFSFDVAKAKQLLTEGLTEEGMTSLKFTLLYNTLPSHKKIAEAIQDMWKKNLGVDVTLENVEFKVKLDREHKLQFDVCRAGWIGDYVDPMTFLDMFTSTNTQNNTGWKNPQYDAFIKDAQSISDNAKRLADFSSAEKILMNDMPITPLYFYTKPYALKPNVKGVYNIVNRYPQLQYAYKD